MLSLDTVVTPLWSALYLACPKIQTPSELLSWSHVVELPKIGDPLERAFYEKPMVTERWGVRGLK